MIQRINSSAWDHLTKEQIHNCGSLEIFFGGRGFTTEKTFWQADMERLAHSPCQLIQVWTDLKSLGWRYLEHVGTSGLPALGIVDYHGLSLPGMIFLYWRLHGEPLPHLKV